MIGALTCSTPYHPQVFLPFHLRKFFYCAAVSGVTRMLSHDPGATDGIAVRGAHDEVAHQQPQVSGAPAATCCNLLAGLILDQQAAPVQQRLGRRRRRKRTRSTRATRKTRWPGQRSEVKPLAWRSLPLMLVTLVGAAPRVRSLITYGVH